MNLDDPHNVMYRYRFPRRRDFLNYINYNWFTFTFFRAEGAVFLTTLIDWFKFTPFFRAEGAIF